MLHLLHCRQSKEKNNYSQARKTVGLHTLLTPLPHHISTLQRTDIAHNSFHILFPMTLSAFLIILILPISKTLMTPISFSNWRSREIKIAKSSWLFFFFQLFASALNLSGLFSLPLHFSLSHLNSFPFLTELQFIDYILAPEHGKCSLPTSFGRYYKLVKQTELFFFSWTSETTAWKDWNP